MNKNLKTEFTGRIWFKILMWAISVCFVIFYLCVFVWGSNPRVGTEYRMYYITHELSDWPGYGKLDYDYGTIEYCTGIRDRNNAFVTYNVCQRKGQGWEREQYDGSVNNNTESSIYYIPVKAKTDAQYVIDINDFSGNGSVKIFANNEEIGEFVSEGRFTFDIREIRENELLQIKFVANDCSFRLWSACIE